MVRPTLLCSVGAAGGGEVLTGQDAVPVPPALPLLSCSLLVICLLRVSAPSRQLLGRAGARSR